MTLVEQRTRGSLRDVLRAFMLNPAACDSVLNDTSLVQLRSEAASEIAEQLKVSVLSSACYQRLQPIASIGTSSDGSVGV